MKRRALLGGLPLLAAVPLRAQSMQRVGILTLTPGEAKTSMLRLVARLAQLGHIERRNLVLDYAAEGGECRTALAAGLIARKPDVIVTGFGTLVAKAAKAATADIPIVFSVVGDPVGAGLVATLAKPGGNVTGLTDQSAEAWAKRVAMLHETTARPSYAALLNPATPFAAFALKVIRDSAAARQLQLDVLEARTADEALAAVTGIDRGSGGLLVVGDPLTTSLIRPIAELAIQQKLATCFQAREGAEAGGLMSYGADLSQLVMRAADYVDRILKGARPADLPVEQPTKFELVLNQRTARLLGLAMPPSILAAADEVIE